MIMMRRKLPAGLCVMRLFPFPPELIQNVRHRRPRRVVVSGAGHLMYLEKPKEFLELVSRFVERNE